MLNEGLSIMAVGVGTVMFFLIVLWFAITIMGKVVGWLNKIFPEQVEQVKTVANNVKSDVEVAIAIAAAKFRK
jgi:sodium pump decarboxylase gamma subunit